MYHNGVFNELNDLLSLDDNDIDFLQKIAKKYDNIKYPFNHINENGELVSVFDSYEHYHIRKDVDSDYRGQPIFHKIANLCKNISKRDSLENIYQVAMVAWVDGYLPFHKDPRDCALSIPLNDIELPLQWQTDDGKFICEYQYKLGMPVLLNTRIDHGCEQNSARRCFLHVSFNQSYDRILNYMQEGQ